MARVTAEQVAEIVEWQDGSNGPVIPLTPFIQQAYLLTNWLHSVDTDNELDDDTLLEIEKNLAAHFYTTQRDFQYQSKSTSGASGSRTDAHSIGFEGTPHGLAALRLDVTANLTKRELEARYGKRISKTTWLGWQDHSEDPYDDT